MTDREFVELVKRVKSLEESSARNERNIAMIEKYLERVRGVEKRVLDIETAFEQFEQAAIPLRQALEDIKAAWGEANP